MENDKLVRLSDVIETIKNQGSDSDNKWGNDNRPRPPYLYIFIDAVKTIDELLDIPTVDAVPVIHGHWEYTFGGYVNCSICDAAPLLDGEKECMETTYCPWCGAKMDEVTE